MRCGGSYGCGTLLLRSIEDFIYRKLHLSDIFRVLFFRIQADLTNERPLFEQEC